MVSKVVNHLRRGKHSRRISSMPRRPGKAHLGHGDQLLAEKEQEHKEKKERALRSEGEEAAAEEEEGDEWERGRREGEVRRRGREGGRDSDDGRRRRARERTM